MQFTPLPLIDDFLLPYNVGQVLLVLFVLVVLGSLPLGSRKVLSLNLILFGVLFIVTPTSLVPMPFTFLGLALVVIGPMIYVTGGR